MKETSIDYQSLFEAGPSNLLILDPYFKIVAVNDAYLSATMTKREEIVGRGLFEVFPDNPDDPNADGTSNLRDSLNKVLLTKSSHNMAIQKYDIRKPAEQGGGFEVRYWSPVNSPVCDKNGKVQYLIHCVADVTEFVLLKTSSAKMQNEIFQRAQELQAANRELETFSYSVSHDLRVPLRGLGDLAKMLLDQYEKNLQPEIKDFFRRLLHSTDVMSSLIDGLLKLSQASRQSLNKKETELSEVVHAVVVELEKLYPHQKVEFICDKGIQAICDAALIRAALMNLLNNAWKFSSKKEISKIQFGVEKKKNQSVYFVKDNGAGFDMNQVGKLFQSFQRLHHTKDFEGTGIGLTTTQRIIERHGGRIWAEGAVDKGATFYFTLD